MRRRVHQVLVVASPYDAFVLEEGGRLTELILNEYIALGLTDPPHVTRATSAEEGLALLRHRRFDLVFTMIRVGAMDGFRFGRTVKEVEPDLPVILLAFDTGEMKRLLMHGSRGGIDHLFTWQGDATLFLAIIKMIEDRWNVLDDTETGQVRVILLVEDSPNFASRYLPALYTELVEQTRLLLDESYNVTQRLLRMRARPKVLWAQSYEECIELYEKLQPYVLGAITDLRFPRDGELDDLAGQRLIEKMREKDPSLPILLQSSQSEAREIAKRFGIHFVNKRARGVRRQMLRFLTEEFGFGDFVFRNADGSEWGRAKDLRELEVVLEQVPSEILLAHSQRNDFSNWLRARTEFELASTLRPRQVEEFKDLEALRGYLIERFHDHRAEQQRGIIADFSRDRYDDSARFVRFGTGSLGGKGRGLAFANTMLQKYNLAREFDDIEIGVPRSAVIGTDCFDQFLADNELYDIALSTEADEKIVAAFLAATLPEEIRSDLRSFLEQVDVPLAVRSSSLLEDSQSQPFAGIYKTYMLSNNHEDVEQRLAQICRAIQLVYASTFSRASKAYIESTAYRVEDEKMAVILQELVGSRHGTRFYPEASGVARSYNYYPVAPMQADDGIVIMALGFGRQVVAGGNAMRFSPLHPHNIPQFSSVDDTLECSQRQFFALDLGNPDSMPAEDELATHVELELKTAEEDGTLRYIASSYIAADHAIRDGLSWGGQPVVTFRPILKGAGPPLAEVLRRVLEIGTEGLGGPVELEYAVDLSSEKPRFGFLQIRRLIAGGEPEDVRIDDTDRDAAICLSERALGNGNYEGVRDIIFIDPDRFERAHTQQLAEEIGRLNTTLRAERRPYVLIGPGRWGSSDPWLGIPVRWDQIDAARVIVEAALPGFRVEPSQGTHFFQNMTSLGMGYFTVNSFAGNGRVDWSWLQDRGNGNDTVCHLSLSQSVAVRIDGRSGEGVILPTSESRT